ncbi:MAG: lysyl oxidase family protein, partial [Solirubrobacteraceae bacterium]
MSMRVVVAQAVLATALLILGAAPASAAPLLPDIVADPPVGGYAPETYSDAEGERLLLRLDGFVHNIGAGALEMRGSGPSDLVMTNVVQRVYDSAGGYADISGPGAAPRMLYETSDGHEHWHLRNAMRYSMWSADKTVEVAPSQKVGFCLVDSQRTSDSAGGRVYSVAGNNFCGRFDTTAPSVYMGVSPGWRDVYDADLTFQWIDISDVPPGRYWLRADADPDGVFVESDENNVGAYAGKESVVNGYVAAPSAAGEMPALASSVIALSAAGYGAPGPLQFKVVTPPAHGTLDQPAGTWFSGSRVRYTPALGWSGPDGFTIAARDATSPYPRNPPAAAVTLAVGGQAAQGRA